MLQGNVSIVARTQVSRELITVQFESPHLAASTHAGQFLNIRAFDGAWGPLLRRPFSVSSIDNNTLSILFNVVGTGTRILSSRRVGDTLDVLGPLGKPFGVPGDYDEAILVGGGVGVAPFPLLTKELLRAGKPVTTLLGARNKEMIFLEGLQNVQLATDDGSVGMRGNVVELLERFFQTNRTIRPKIFGCGPTPMLRALSEFAKRMNLYCELSLEGDMACGVGICQGCPVERTNGEKQYALTCVEGPTFDCREVRL